MTINRTLHHNTNHQALPRAGLRLPFLTPADWRAAIYAAAGLATLAIAWAVTALPAACSAACLAANL